MSMQDVHTEDLQSEGFPSGNLNSARNPVSIGVLGGTFNPPHVGHLALARGAREQLGLACVLMMPANIAPNKHGNTGRPSAREDPGAEQRLAMCRIAVAGEPGIEASALEVERGGVSYTVDTLRALHAMHPEAELTLIVGADTARTMSSWREPEELLELASLAVAERDELDADAVGKALAGLRVTPRMTMLRMNKIDVSSSRVRELVAVGAPVTELVGEGVASYIAEHGLYDPTEAYATMDGDT